MYIFSLEIGLNVGGCLNILKIGISFMNFTKSTDVEESPSKCVQYTYKQLLDVR